MSEQPADDLNKQIELAIAQLDRQFGKGSVMRLDDEPIKWPCIPTGAINLDIALGIGGLPQGRICEVYGPESSGKSTLCLQVIANAQGMGKTCMFIDAEHALDPVYAKALGVKLPELLLSQPSNGEEAIDIAEMMIKTGALRNGVCVIDSVAALVPKAELDGDMDASHMGLQPRLMAKAMRRLVPLAAETNTLILFTNQIREKIGVMFGSPETQPGGRALKFAASVRIDLRRIESIQDKAGEDIIGNRVKAKVIKNKMAPPLRVVEFNIMYGRGVDFLRCILDLGADHGVIDKKGAWYSYEGTQLGQGPKNAVEHLASDMEMTRKIEKEIYERV